MFYFVMYNETSTIYVIVTQKEEENLLINFVYEHSFMTNALLTLQERNMPFLSTFAMNFDIIKPK